MRIGIFGAGAIGCYVGGRLLASGVDTLLVGRASVAGEIAAHGLWLSERRRPPVRIPPFSIATTPEGLATCDAVLVAVKSVDTASAAAILAPLVAPDAIVVSLQNGVENAAELRRVAPRTTVLAGMVPFNVRRAAGARFHRGTGGRLILERGPGADELVALLSRAGVPARAELDVAPFLWGKLLFNLSNAVNALAGVPIRRMLEERAFRLVMAACIDEGMAALRGANIRPRLEPRVPAGLVPRMLALGDRSFALARLLMPHVDAEARSSMWDDLERGRRTEVDALNGAIVRLAARVATPAPVNAALVDLVHRVEDGALARAEAPTALRGLAATSG